MVGSCGLDRCYKCTVGAGGGQICVADLTGTLTSCAGNPCSGGGSGSGGGVVPPVTTSTLATIIIPSSATVEIGKTTTLTATCKDKNGNIMTCPTLKWGSGTSNVTVNNGVVTAVSLGTALVNCWDVATGLASNICSITIKTPTCTNPKYKCSGITCISDNCDGTGTFTTPDCNNTCTCPDQGSKCDIGGNQCYYNVKTCLFDCQPCPSGTTCQMQGGLAKCVSTGYTVTMTIIGNGTVVVESSSGTETFSSSNTRTYSQFDMIRYTAIGSSGYQFSSFSLDEVVTTLPNLQISAINSNKKMTVIFTHIATGKIVLNSVEWVTPNAASSQIKLNVTTNGSTSTYLKVDADPQQTLIYSSSATSVNTTGSYDTSIPHGICLGTPTPTQCKNLDAVAPVVVPPVVIPPVTPPGCTNPKYKWVGGICASDDCDGTGVYTDSACTSGGGGGSGTATGVLSSITIDGTVSVQVGKTVTLTAICKDANGNTGTCPDLVWQSDNESIAKVSAGIITGVSVGTVNILVKDNATSQIISNTAIVTVGTGNSLTDWLQSSVCLDSTNKKYCAKNWMWGAGVGVAFILLTRK